MKGGIYGNSADRKTLASNRSGTGGDERGVKVEGKNTSFFGEANVMVNAAMGHGWYIRGGYTGLFLTGVATGSDALLVPAGGHLPTTRDMIAHGFYGGLEWQY